MLQYSAVQYSTVQCSTVFSPVFPLSCRHPNEYLYVIFMIIIFLSLSYVQYAVSGWPSDAPTISRHPDNDSNEMEETKVKKTDASSFLNLNKYRLPSKDLELPFSWAIKKILESSSFEFSVPDSINWSKIQKDKRDARKKKYEDSWAEEV